MKHILFALTICLGLTGLVQAQTLSTGLESTSDTVTVPDALTPETVRDLVSGLSDQEVRALLLDRLDAVAEAQALTSGDGPSGFGGLVELATIGVFQSVSEAVRKLPDAGGVLARAYANFRAQIGPNGLSVMAIVLIVALTGAVIIEFVFRRAVRRWVNSAETSGNTGSLRSTLTFLGKRLTADIVAVFIFFAAALAIGNLVGRNIGPLMLDSFEQRMTVASYIGSLWFFLIVLPRLFGAIGRFLMAPHRPEFRIVNIDDASARGLFYHQFGVGLVLGLTFWLPNFLVMTGETFGSSRIGFWLNLALHLYIIYLAYTRRQAFSMMMRGSEPDITKGEAWAARIYPWFVIGAVIFTWWLVEILVGFGQFALLMGLPHIWMLLTISFAPAMDTAIRGTVRHLMPPMTGEGAVAERAWESSRRSYIRIGRVIVFGLIVMFLARIWQIDLGNLAAASVGAQFAGRLIEMMIVLAFGYLLYELVSLYINQKLAAEMTASGYDPDNADFGGDGGGAGGSRLSTVLPLVLWAARTAIVMIFVLLALGSIGVDTTPLLAGAGIVGLAVGFGAQKLVSDVVSGIFFLVDDAFRTGEYVEVDGTMGTVEKISIRSMQLRHHRGPVHTIPYGEIPKLTNYSRDWVIMKLKFTVPFDTDPNKVKKIFKKIGAEMMDNELYQEDFLQPFKSQGVFEIDDVGMVMRGKFMAKPGKQFMIRKEIYNKVKAEFEANGIDFARREVRVALPGHADGEPLSPEEEAAVAAAASAAAQEQQAAKPGAK